ncbi:conserved hypothetical protein [Arthrobacter sp. 9AX]|uniref:hypothetical protein n=1 Tax=Arthrobacter sp. 9AX TaxID=2653131 RepID=UPI0012F05E64|nr:hypothetical protein [Arthrobacter sp. 9AX]VXC15237.1 conserved hypothetical protein [Arthrobacter sp. 9AX]
MTYNPLAVTEPGEPESFAYASIDASMRLIWDDLDGDIIGPIHASHAEVRQYDTARGEYRQQSTISDIRMDCYVTTARFAMICTNYDKGGGWVGGGAALLLNAGSKLLAAGRSRGRALAGHLRYPWLDSILFQPKDGLFGAETLRLAFHSDGTPMYLQLTLDKTTDATALAHEIMQRTIAYRRRDTHPLDRDETAALNALLAAGPAPLPQKGTMGAYRIPTSWPAGTAAQYAPRKGQGDEPPESLH